MNRICRALRVFAGFRLSALALAPILALPGCACLQISQPADELPPLLQNVSAGGGNFSACPPVASETLPIAISPELDQRLSQQFPPGFDDASLVQTLTAQGFKLSGHCEADPTVQRASFFQKGVGCLAYDTIAEVFCKKDDRDRIVWTKGLVRYSGL